MNFGKYYEYILCSGNISVRCPIAVAVRATLRQQNDTTNDENVRQSDNDFVIIILYNEVCLREHYHNIINGGNQKHRILIVFRREIRSI